MARTEAAGYGHHCDDGGALEGDGQVGAGVQHVAPDSCWAIEGDQGTAGEVLVLEVAAQVQGMGKDTVQAGDVGGYSHAGGEYVFVCVQEIGMELAIFDR